MSFDDDTGLETARQAAAAGLQEFEATLTSFQNRPNPNPARRPVGGVALPHMGAHAVAPPVPPRPGAPAPPPRPGTPPVPPRLGTSQSGGANSQALRRHADQIALQTMMEARRDFIPSLFTNAHIKYKGGKSPADELKRAAKDFYDRAKSTKEALEKDLEQGRSFEPTGSPSRSGDLGAAKKLGERAFQLLGELEPGDWAELGDVIGELTGGVLTDLGSSLLPFVGTAKAGYRAGSAALRVGAKQKQVHATKQAREKLIKGDPEKAIASVQRLLERERNALGAEAGIAAAKLGADVAGYFVDLGIASGIATSCAEAVGRLTLNIRMIVRDAREKKAANDLVDDGHVNARIFEECPLLGAYAVLSAETSDLVGFLGGDPQRHGFTLDDLARLIKKHNEPLIRNATELIGKSRLEVVGLPTNKAAARAKVQAQKGSLKARIQTRVKEELKKHAPRS